MRRLPSFSSAPTLSSPRFDRSVINLASEFLNLAPPPYRFYFISSDTFEFSRILVPFINYFIKYHVGHAQLNLLRSVF